MADSQGNSAEIRLNEPTPTDGRPRLDRTKPKQQAKAALKEFNQCIRLRGPLRDKDVCEIVACLQEIRPALHEVTSFMKIYNVHEVKRASNFTWKVDKGFVPDIVQFRLPEDAIQVVLDDLEAQKSTLNDGQAIDETISLDGASQSASSIVAGIPTIGNFRREQLEAMR